MLGASASSFFASLRFASLCFLSLGLLASVRRFFIRDGHCRDDFQLIHDCSDSVHTSAIPFAAPAQKGAHIPLVQRLASCSLPELVSLRVARS